MEDIMSYKSEVNRQIRIGLLLLLITGFVLWIVLPNFSDESRFRVLALSALILVIPLFCAITNIVLSRYSNERLITGYKSDYSEIAFRAAFLQNTQEQTLVNFITLIALGLVVPQTMIKLTVIQSLCFLVGRIAFFVSYKSDPMKRFSGFVVGWYSAIASFLTAVYWLIVGVI